MPCLRKALAYEGREKQKQFVHETHENHEKNQKAKSFCIRIPNRYFLFVRAFRVFRGQAFS